MSLFATTIVICDIGMASRSLPGNFKATVRPNLSPQKESYHHKNRHYKNKASQYQQMQNRPNRDRTSHNVNGTSDNFNNIMPPLLGIKTTRPDPIVQFCPKHSVEPSHVINLLTSRYIFTISNSNNFCLGLVLTIHNSQHTQ